MTDQPPFVCAEEGSVELLEFSWPLLQDLDIDQEPETCLAYAVMRRPNGFLLCVPSGFFREGDLLAAQTAEDDALLGPSVEPGQARHFPFGLGGCQEKQYEAVTRPLCQSRRLGL